MSDIIWDGYASSVGRCLTCWLCSWNSHCGSGLNVLRSEAVSAPSWDLWYAYCVQSHVTKQARKAFHLHDDCHFRNCPKKCIYKSILLRHLFKLWKNSKSLTGVMGSAGIKTVLFNFLKTMLKGYGLQVNPRDFISKWFFWQIRSVTGLIKAE